MTVKELIDELGKYPKDAIVSASRIEEDGWEDYVFLKRMYLLSNYLKIELK